MRLLSATFSELVNINRQQWSRLAYMLISDIFAKHGFGLLGISQELIN